MQLEEEMEVMKPISFDYRTLLLQGTSGGHLIYPHFYR